jgi:excisionase family DNA binding protein
MRSRRPVRDHQGATAGLAVLSQRWTREKKQRVLAKLGLAYSIDDAARLTGLSRDLLYDQMRCGNLPYVKVGRRRLITRHHLQQFLGDPPQ